MNLYDLTLEQTVLGSCILTPSWMPDALRAEHFYAPEHGDLWNELRMRQRDGRLIDYVTLKPFVIAHAALSKLGENGSYLLKMDGTRATSMHQVSSYADMLREMARKRAVSAACDAAKAQTEGDALTTLEQRLQEIASNDTDADAWERLGVLACESVERSILGETKGISTGFPSLDRATGGVQPGTLWVVGGATSMGKSVFGAGLGRNIAAQGFGVGEIHLEMDATQIGLRTSTALAFEPDHKADNPFYLTAQRGELTPAQQAKLVGASKAAASLPIYTDARAGRSLGQIEAAARRLFRKMRREGIRPGALIIDHEGLIAPEAGSRFPSQLERANARSEALLAMAKRLGVAVIALSQITKEGSRADGEERLPQSTDLNYGSAISQAAQVVILLHRPAYFEERKPRALRDPDKLRSRACTLVIDKARGGMRSHVEVLMDMPTAAVWEP